MSHPVSNSLESNCRALNLHINLSTSSAQLESIELKYLINSDYKSQQNSFTFDVKQNILQQKKKTLKCKICNTIFSTNWNLSRHLSSVHEGKKPFQCSFCGALFSTKVHMKAHITKVHEGNHPHECQICNATFQRKCTLTQHMNEVHNQKNFKCTNCDGSFKKLEDMVTHIETLHS